jgi:endogenous inhibitor of DNA gyrase (YacG/DUF329 family)
VTRQRAKFKGERAYCDKPECRQVGAKPRNRITLTCDRPTCGKQFDRTPSRADDGARHFCSVACRAASQGEWLRVEYEPLVCPGCDQEWTPTPTQVSQGQVACSHRCAGILRRRPPGTRYIDSSGYAWITTEDGKSVLEHRLVMERAIGRALLPEETVHHKTGGEEGRSDNRLENLELWTGRHPKGHRVEDVTEFALEHLRLYAPDLLAAS